MQGDLILLPRFQRDLADGERQTIMHGHALVIIWFWNF